MTNYKLSNTAVEDLIRIYQFGVKKFGIRQAEKYYNSLFECFEVIADNPHSFTAIDHIRTGYRRCPCSSDSIYFRISDSNEVEIMAIIGKQDLKDIL